MITGVLIATWMEWMQERGGIFFFCRPKVDKDEARGPDDVQRMAAPSRRSRRHTLARRAASTGLQGERQQRGRSGRGRRGHTVVPAVKMVGRG